MRQTPRQVRSHRTSDRVVASGRVGGQVGAAGQPGSGQAGSASGSGPDASSGRNGAGFRTLIGNGFLRESPRNFVPWAMDIRGKSAMRKCMYLPVPLEIQALARPSQVAPAQQPPRPVERAIDRPIVAHRHDPSKDVRMFAAYDAQKEAARRVAMDAAYRAQGGYSERRQRSTSGERAWWEDPVALGSLLLLAPPIGLAALWSSHRYGPEARWALTIMTGLTMCLVAAVVTAFALMR